MTDLLTLKNVSKSFGSKKVVDDVSFSVPKGKIVGLLRKNGSGKTTILKMINDLLTVDQGEILVCGQKIDHTTKAKVSFLSERTYLSPEKTVKQTFDFFEDFYADFDRAKAEELLKDLELDINAKLSKMSKGMKEKIQLILVMSRRASLYVLDEPLGGVDPSTRDYIMQTILKNFGENSSILITTHLIYDIEKIIDQVIFIDNGKIVLNRDAEELREEQNASIDEIFRRTV